MGDWAHIILFIALVVMAVVFGTIMYEMRALIMELRNQKEGDEPRDAPPQD